MTRYAKHHHTPDDAHDCNVKLAQQEQIVHKGIYVAILDPDLGFWFEDLHPDRQPSAPPATMVLRLLRTDNSVYRGRKGLHLSHGFRNPAASCCFHLHDRLFVCVDQLQKGHR